MASVLLPHHGGHRSSSHHRDSRAPLPPFKSAPVGPLRTEAQISIPVPMDTPMTDANLHPSPSSAPNSSSSQSNAQYRTHQQQQMQASSSEPQPSVTKLDIPCSYDGAGVPRSPRFKGHNSTTAASQLAAPRSVPSPVTSHSQGSPTSALATPTRVKVKSLSHIQSFVLDECNPLSHSASRSRMDRRESAPQYEISEMPVTDIIEMVAGLLTKITSTNDRQHEHLHRQIPPPEGTAGLSQQTTSVLAFHGKNVPSISILSYLSRIHKYCPTTYEVFLSLLVYFDRMTERVNSGPMQNLRHNRRQSLDGYLADSEGSRHSSVSSLAQESHEIVHKGQQQTTTPPPSGSLGKPADAARQRQQGYSPSPPTVVPVDSPVDDLHSLSHFFVVDSFNIHRLVIAGVTCASKFFSDIFYTNSRYAKVGGLPLPELNHLELQFLLLNDFRLAVPLEEMEAYGTMLVEFYAREVLANHSTKAAQCSETIGSAVS